mgnify:CR=1 FL=1
MSIIENSRIWELENGRSLPIAPDEEKNLSLAIAPDQLENLLLEIKCGASKGDLTLPIPDTWREDLSSAIKVRIIWSECVEK